MSFELAPIVISVYTRLEHFKQCIEALQKNLLAMQSKLFIYSDAASKPEDEKLVKQVREYSHNIQGFKAVYVIEREKNYGGTKNARLAHQEITKRFGKSIFLEDDIMTAPGFLTFMNEGLEVYKDEDNIFSITGYSPPINIPDDYDKDVFVITRYNGWGSGIWQRSMEQMPEKICHDEFIKIKNKIKLFSAGGADILGMIEKEVNCELDAQDVRNMYFQALHNKFTVYPRKSLVQNIGHDGSGVHCGANDKFHHENLWDKTEGFEFPKDIQMDKRIIKANYKFRSRGLKSRMVHLTKQLGIYPLLKVIKDKVTR